LLVRMEFYSTFLMSQISFSLDEGAYQLIIDSVGSGTSSSEVVKLERNERIAGIRESFFLITIERSSSPSRQSTERSQHADELESENDKPCQKSLTCEISTLSSSLSTRSPQIRFKLRLDKLQDIKILSR